MIVIKEVSNKKEQKQFLDFQGKLYKGNKYWVPVLYSDEKKIFSSTNPVYDQCEAKFFLAYKDNKVVGKIAGIYPFECNKKWNQNRIRFSRIDMIDDQEVADALLNAVKEYGVEKGCKEMVGPLGFNDNDREGLLIEGFNYLNGYIEQYNYDYYQKLIEHYGFSKEHDWLMYRMKPIKGSYEKMIRASEFAQKKFKLHLVSDLSGVQMCDKYGQQVMDLWEKEYSGIYGTTPFTDQMKKDTVEQFKLLVHKDFLQLLADENDNLVGISLAWGGFGHCLQRCNGHLTPLTILGILKNTRKPKYIEYSIVGVKKEYQKLGVGSIMMAPYIKYLSEHKDYCKYMDSDLMLEYNTSVLGLVKYFDNELIKRRRCYIKNI